MGAPLSPGADIPGNSEGWKKFWKIFVILVIVVWIVFVIFAYNQGKKGNPKYVPFYTLITKPSWQHFREWLAHSMNDPWTEILIVFFFMIIPLPFLPYHAHERLELFFAKLGVVYLLVTIILGRPQYDAKENKSASSYSLGFAFLIFVIVVALISYVNKYKPETFSSVSSYFNS